MWAQRDRTDITKLIVTFLGALCMCIVMDHRHRMWRYLLSVYIYRGKLKLIYVAVILMKHVWDTAGLRNDSRSKAHMFLFI